MVRVFLLLLFGVVLAVRAKHFTDPAELWNDKKCIGIRAMMDKAAKEHYQIIELRHHTPITKTTVIKKEKYDMTLYPWICCPESGCDTTPKSSILKRTCKFGKCKLYYYVVGKCKSYYYCFQPKKYKYHKTGHIKWRAYIRTAYKKECETKIVCRNKSSCRSMLQRKTCS